MYLTENSPQIPAETNPVGTIPLLDKICTRIDGLPNADGVAPLYSEGCGVLAEFIEAYPLAAGRCKRGYAKLTDAVLRSALRGALGDHDPKSISLIAVGGYGRAEMAPGSDVDILFLSVKDAPVEVIEKTLYVLWDLKMKVGHAVRTISQCLSLAREDFTIRTSLVEMRPIEDPAGVGAILQNRLYADLFAGSEAEFIEAKLAERRERHRKQGGQRYMVEPNVKEGKGGLRDLQSLYWIAKYVHRTRYASTLVDLGVFTTEEYETFRSAENFLWSVRIHLHLLAGRASEQLRFDRQVEVAERMGYEDSAGRRGVEIFMQDYFRHATSVGELTRIFLIAMEDQHVKKVPMLQRLMPRRRSVSAPYAVANNRLTVANPDTFLDDPVNMIRIFAEALRTGTLLHSDALRLLAANLPLIDETVQRDKEANRIFLDIMLKYGNPERGLRRMNEIGILGAFIPEFANIVAMMQFNMYHHFTVDEHTIQCISILHQLEMGDLSEDLPEDLATARSAAQRRVLYVAMLLHDIGKGRPEDHSIIGARIARKLAPRFGLNAKNSATVEWLVRNHLLMSDTAQKRDLADPKTVRGFAKAVGSLERLDLLTILTVCDIRGVGPDTWNNWKGQLIANLYQATRDALVNGLEDLNRGAVEAEAKKALRAALPDWDPKEIRREIRRYYGPYWQGLPTQAHVRFAHLLRNLGEDDIGLELMPDHDRDATRLIIALADHPGLFSRLTGAIAVAGANIVDGRTYTSRDGFATAAFWLQDDDGHPFDAERLPKLRKSIDKILRGEVITRDALEPKDKIRERERAFRVPTQIAFDNEGSDVFTIIEVDTRDRAGLLFDLTRMLAKSHLYIAHAVIATYGEQVVDTFYVKDMFGLKFTSASKQKSLESNLRDAIAQGARRAVQ